MISYTKAANVSGQSEPKPGRGVEEEGFLFLNKREANPEASGTRSRKQAESRRAGAQGVGLTRFEAKGLGGFE